MRNKPVTFIVVLTLAVALLGCGRAPSPDVENAAGPAVETTAPPGPPAPSVNDEVRLLDGVQRTAEMRARYFAIVEWQSIEAWLVAAEAYQAQLDREAEAAAGRRARAPEADDQGADERDTPTGRCGGNLPPCSVMECESGGDIHAQNPNSSASGKWQVIDSTWGNYMGYPTAASAPEWVQDQFAAELYAGGAGRGHWEC